MKLYEIADEIELILAREVDHETGEITDETIEKLADLEMARTDKALAVAAYLKGELAEADAVLREVDALKKRADGHKKRAARLVSYLEGNLPRDEGPISDARSRITWRKNPPRVVLDPNQVVPEEYLRVIPETSEPDKKAIKAALVDGKALNFAVLNGSSRLEIK